MNGEDQELLELSGMLENMTEQILDRAWVADEKGGNVAAVYAVLADAGLSSLGMDQDRAQLPIWLALMRVLGRETCSAPLPAALLTNFALGDQSSAGKGRPVAFSFAGHDGDRDAGSVELLDGKVSGHLRFLEHLDISDALYVVVSLRQIARIDLASPEVRIGMQPGMARPDLFEIWLKGAPAVFLDMVGTDIQELHIVARLLYAARALGAARRGLDMVLEYAVERSQFGKLIGSFQAIQHKLANSRIVLDAATLQMNAAAAEWHTHGPEAIATALASIVFCGQWLRQVSLETHHCFGAIGFAEEHAAARQFRLIHADISRLGGLIGAREAYAHAVLDGDEAASQVTLTDDATAEIRQEIRAWLDQVWTEADRAACRLKPFENRNWDLAFARRMGEAGWTTLNWPIKAGGQGRSPLEQLAFAEEMLRADAPDGSTIAGSRLLAPEIIAHGSDVLKENMLPLLRNGEASVCLGYSEPGSGSDLASLKTRAEDRGDHFIVNGQKIWTSDAHRCSHMILAARTSPDPTVKHSGISLFVVPMDTPGITVHRMPALHGHIYCSVFFDDVRVPAAWLLGKVGGGWRILTNALASERVVMGAFASQLDDLMRRIIVELKHRGLTSDSYTRQEIAGLSAEVKAARQLSLRSISLSGGDYTPLVESAMAKVFASELSQRLMERAIDIFGATTILETEADGAVAGGIIGQLLRRSIMMVVGGGSNEIQRNVIALRGLNLPQG
jgi:alkylation response protein AidB-like acyl-CoA dehydrogenase